MGLKTKDGRIGNGRQLVHVGTPKPKHMHPTGATPSSLCPRCKASQWQHAMLIFQAMRPVGVDGIHDSLRYQKGLSEIFSLTFLHHCCCLHGFFDDHEVIGSVEDAQEVFTPAGLLKSPSVSLIVSFQIRFEHC